MAIADNMALNACINNLINARHLTAQEIHQAVIADVRQHIGEAEIMDDWTLLILKQR
jgi:serine phosphatase RsbU (regulator of sigma subunit)